jgi:hypothetical protein
MIAYTGEQLDVRRFQGEEGSANTLHNPLLLFLLPFEMVAHRDVSHEENKEQLKMRWFTGALAFVSAASYGSQIFAGITAFSFLCGNLIE